MQKNSHYWSMAHAKMALSLATTLLLAAQTAATQSTGSNIAAAAHQVAYFSLG
jgi:hypothetical protein